MLLLAISSNILFLLTNIFVANIPLLLEAFEDFDQDLSKLSIIKQFESS